MGKRRVYNVVDALTFFLMQLKYIGGINMFIGKAKNCGYESCKEEATYCF